MKNVELKMNLKTETKTCFRFETTIGDDLITLYLKKYQVKDAGIDPEKGIVVRISQE